MCSRWCHVLCRFEGAGYDACMLNPEIVWTLVIATSGLVGWGIAALAYRRKTESHERVADWDIRTLLYSSIAALFCVASYAFVRWRGSESGWKELALVGDSYGGVNALVSALAFGAFLVAIWMQREELSLQRGELTLTRNELSKTAEAQEITAQLLDDQLRLQLASAHVSALTSRLQGYAARRQISGQLHVNDEEASRELVAHLDEVAGKIVEWAKHEEYEIASEIARVIAYEQETVYRERSGPPPKEWKKYRWDDPGLKGIRYRYQYERDSPFSRTSMHGDYLDAELSELHLKYQIDYERPGLYRVTIERELSKNEIRGLDQFGSWRFRLLEVVDGTATYLVS